jgi:hypothetical protein
MAFGHSANEDPTGVTFEQVSPDPDDEDDPGPVLDQITITRGRVGDAPTTGATTIETRLRDTDGDFSPRNVSGAHYGELLMDTPVQVTVDVGFGDTPLATAYQPDWNPIWDGPDINDRVPVNAVGLLAILGRDQEVRSALKRAILDLSDINAPVDYWPMEDGAQSGQFASAISSGLPMTVTDADLASTDDLPGSGPLATFTATTALHGTFTLHRHAADGAGLVVRVDAEVRNAARCEHDPRRGPHRWRGRGPLGGQPERLHDLSHVL